LTLSPGFVYRPSVSAIALRGVSKLWGSVRAVDDVSFEAGAGTLVVLLGPSGCGKSTTLRLIAGLERASGGRVLIGHEDVTDLPPAARHIAMVFQSYALFPHLSVAENIVFGLRVRRVPAVDRARRLARVAELLGLEDLLARKPSQLSGGQQQRVALGRAIIAEQPVCLMDEPLSNLDAQLRVEMRREIRALQRKLGITMLYVTHDQTEAMTMADQVILLREGRVEQDAAPADLYACPATVFAARFIGTPPMNILALAPGPEGAVVAGTSGPAIHRGAAGGLLAGVRPEDVQVGAAPAGARGVCARVTGVEYLGADSIVTCVAGSESLAARVVGRTDLMPGAGVRLHWPAGALHIFDAATGRRHS
jgi:sn-glycerol 3-phosphate transport system ATP-binding protein